VKEMRKMGLCMSPINKFEEIDHLNESRYESHGIGCISTFVGLLISSSEKTILRWLHRLVRWWQFHSYSANVPNI
jgi:hypothetical protein